MRIHSVKADRLLQCFFLFLFLGSFTTRNAQLKNAFSTALRQRISLNEGWRFMRYTGNPDQLIYDERPKVTSHNDNLVADTRAADTGRHFRGWRWPSCDL